MGYDAQIEKADQVAAACRIDFLGYFLPLNPAQITTRPAKINTARMPMAAAKFIAWLRGAFRRAPTQPRH